MKYTDIIFDIDGTILDTEYADLTGLRQALREVLGRDFDMEELRPALGIPSADVAHTFGVSEADLPRCVELWDAGMRRAFSTVALFPGIERAIRRLGALGHRLGIVTSKTRDEYDHDFPRFGIAELFDVVVTSSDTRLHKPHAEPILHYMERAGADPDRTIYIGDSLYDLRAARAAGIDFALAQWRSHCTEPEKATYRLERPEDIFGILA
jgi:HAD superfamily hydrolase (TIGR01549 family)